MFTIALKTNETWLICGGRDFADRAMFEDVMSRLTQTWGCPETIVHGGAKGADAMADTWAERMAIQCIACPADWEKHGKAAGPIRNEDMLMNHKPTRVIAFPGGIGTADMVRRAHKQNGITVVEVHETIAKAVGEAYKPQVTRR